MYSSGLLATFSRSKGSTVTLTDQEPMTPRWAAAAVRLAHVHHWRGEYAEAHELLDAAEEVFAGSGEQGQADGRMLALVAQHRAKVLFDEGRLTPAEEAARLALRLRTELGEAQGVLASSRQTVDRIVQQRGGPTPAG